ncbi:serine hydrolase domain-containing protein [Chromobacterium subtsugae]|uniref:serine hydrolase domain-containing protein n=1 Tax=Chromobacterium subtsugae TaxID=251747 RepID=UPI00064113CF|nr:serine hydrolase domain-containing protein [Chromobacterium subtsugae]
MLTAELSNPVVQPGVHQYGIAERIDDAIHRALAEQRLVGAVVLVSVDGKLIYQGAKGWADREAERPMTADALFRLSSLSKVYVSTAALAMVEAGIIGLDDAVTRWLPHFAPALPDGRIPEITVRHLLTHTAGLGYGFLEGEQGGPYKQMGISDGMDHSVLSLRENIERLGQAPLLAEPGSAWIYSLATDVLGEVLERATGSHLHEVVRKWVTEPLGLQDTRFAASDYRRLTTVYVNEQPAPRRMRDLELVPILEGFRGVSLAPGRALDHNAFPSGGAGMVGTAGDFMTLLESLRSGGGPLLSAAMAAEMGRNQTGDLPLAPWPGRGYGLGFTVLTDPQAANTPESPGSWRLAGVFGHSWFVDPAKRISVVALTNTLLEGMLGQFTVDICNAVYGQV